MAMLGDLAGTSAERKAEAHGNDEPGQDFERFGLFQYSHSFSLFLALIIGFDYLLRTLLLDARSICVPICRITNTTPSNCACDRVPANIENHILADRDRSVSFIEASH